MFDVLVIGGGHAGCEAASAAARRGARTALLTLRTDDVGQMSCNPSIGGVGKGHLVREVDVFDGLIARAADRATIHRRMLNLSKGPAVWGPRIQADRKRFRDAVGMLLGDAGVEILPAEVIGLRTTGGEIAGVETSIGSLRAVAVVIATGTFLNARLFIGNEVKAGGRHGGRAALKLARQVSAMGFRCGRLKTGTPPRLDVRTVDWAKLENQPSDKARWTMSAMDDGVRLPQLECGITRTNGDAHDIIAANFDQSPLFDGAIGGRGPRYCPSIEDKVKRFAHRDAHQIFVEPEGLDDATVYPNGISTSLPADVQLKFVRAIQGFERVQITRPGYAVEYEHIDPRSLGPTLESRNVRGLFFAGQVNGTTGYEEAAAQGLVAGLNAAARAKDLDEVRFDRRTSYIGVLVDDLTLQGVSEPYRMLTARAEFRLALRADNAVTRLGEVALASNFISNRRRAHIEHHFANRRTTRWAASEEGKADALYAPYVARQEREWERLTVARRTPIQPDFLYENVPGLSTEMIERLTAAQPTTLDEASRVPGVSPAALSALHVACARYAT